MPAVGRIFRNTVSRLVALGNTTRQIFRFLKLDRKFRNTANSIITNAIEFFRQAFNRGRAANRASSTTTIGEIFNKDKKKRPIRVCVNYEFKHTMRGKSKRGSNQGSSDLGSVEVNASDTMKQVHTKILAVIQTWLDRYYQTSNRREIKSSLLMTSIQEC